MRRSRLLHLLLFAIICALLLFSGTLVVLHCWDPTWPSAAAWERVQIGMSEEEVVQILGKPSYQGKCDYGEEPASDKPVTEMLWEPAGRGTCWLGLDAQRRVVDKSAYMLPSELVEQPTTLEAILKKFGSSLWTPAR